MKKIPVFFILAALCLTFTALYADDVSLERIVVTPSRIAQSYTDIMRAVDIITSDEIQATQATDLGEALKALPTINLAEYGGPGATKTVRLRGSSAAQVSILIDGRPHNSPRDGEADISTIPLDNIERIEVMRGPASSLYGSSAMGGTINIITKNPPRSGQATELGTSIGSWRTYTGWVSHGGRVSDLGYRINAGYQTSEGFRDNSELDAKDASIKLAYEFNPENSLTLNSAFYTSRTGTPGPLGSPDPDDKQSRTNNFADLLWKGAVSGGLDISARVYRSYDRLEFMENSVPTAWDTAFDKSIHATVSEGLELQLSKELADSLTSILGVSYASNKNDSTSTAKHRYLVRSWFLNNNWDATESLSLNAGARVDDYSNFGSETSPSLGFLYKINKANRVRGVYSRSFRAPTFNDLFWPNQGWAIGNPLLKPEKGTTWEAGFTSDITPAITCDLSYYRSKYSDLINWAPDETGWIWTPTNINSAVIDGIEFNSQVRLWDRWAFNAGYAFLRAKDLDTKNYLVYQPKHRANFALSYQCHWGLLLELRGEFTSQRFHNAANTLKVEHFADFGLSARQKIKDGVSCFLSIDNLLDRHYQVIHDYPMPGFAVTGGVKVEL